MEKSKMSLAKKMAIALVLGVVVGIGAILLRVKLVEGGNPETWNTINNLLFTDITAEGNEKAIGNDAEASGRIAWCSIWRYVWRLNLYQSGLRKKYLQKTGTTD